ncbi:protein kinase [Flavobacteriaceae bacterium]|nr:protein kinase [Flavobacteriaceae bacterium]
MIKLENYKIIKKIASGGMGDVYLAQHTVLENKVAIKSLHSDLVSDEDFRKRFRTEARTQSKLSHPNIVKLIDFQERKDGLFLIMEYVDGEQLNNHIRKISGPIPDDKLVPLFMQVLSAIKYAHSKGLIHRDIKPSNILITYEGNAKVIDFGIAKSSDEDKGLTKTGVQVGTVSYMSPEQVNAEKLDILTDIYSLGIMLFQMAVGKAPYSEQTNTFKIQLSIVSEPLPNPKEIYPSISDKLVSIIEKATQKKKEDRYQSCEEFIKSFDKDEVVEKIKKSKPIKNFEKPLTNSKKIVSIKKKRKIPLFIYIVIGFISVLSIYYFVEENRGNTSQYDYIKKDEDPELIDEQDLQSTINEETSKTEQNRLTKIEKNTTSKFDTQSNTNNSKKDNLKVVDISDSNGTRTEFYDDGWYKGEFKNNKFHGSGVYKFNNGEEYSGEFKDGKRNGYGTFKFNNGEEYSGNWKNNLKHGQGKYIFRYGEILTGRWTDDKQPYKPEKKLERKTHITTFSEQWNSDRYYESLQSYGNARLQKIIISPNNTQIDLYTQLYKNSVGVGPIRVSFQGKRYWSIPTLSYIKIKGSQKKYKLISVYKKGSVYQTGDYTENLEFEVLKDFKTNFWSMSKRNYNDMYFAFIFEKLPDGASDINIYVGGSNVYKNSDWNRFKKWEDIFYNNFENIRVINPKVESIKNQTAKSNYSYK